MTSGIYDLNIFTCCNNGYEDFAPIFILSNLIHNDNAVVEVGVENADVLDWESFEYLNELYPERFLVRKVEFTHRSYHTFPHTVRFYTEPLLKTKYVYISDIDIITLERDICNKHVANMTENNSPFSNIIRGVTERLTGLHFTPYENYYPVPNFDDLVPQRNIWSDEEILYKLVEKKIGKVDFGLVYRPVHGIHVSLRRDPYAKKLNWGLNKWVNEWKHFRNTEEFIGLEPFLTEFMKEKVSIIDTYYQELAELS